MNSWIVRVVRKAQLSRAGAITLDPNASVAEAWETVCATCGVAPEELAKTIAKAFSMEVADFQGAEPTATRLLPGSVARKLGVFPLRDEERFLVVATSNPVDRDAEQEVGFVSGRAARFKVAPPGLVSEAIEAAYSADVAAASLLSRVDHQFMDMGDVEVDMAAEKTPEEISEADAGTGPIVRLTNIVLQEAILRGASDIHIQPMLTNGVVRFRTDGVLHNGMQMPLPVMTRIVSRIKIMGRLDITDRLRPQDGRARIVVAGKQYDLRISTVPTRRAEKAVIRVLDTQGAGTLVETGIVEGEIVRIRAALSNRDGIIVVTGPTGSGKTTTMYGALREISTEDVNIMTVEDPVEYELPRLTQIQVETKQGMTFASALRAILRQDPDVIFVGEIRDRETAEVAAQASLTGHLVLATLHTNDAVGSIRRFLDLGLDAGTIGETLRGVLAQRLVRKVCKHCAERVDRDLSPTEDALAVRYGRQPVMRAKGCTKCMGQGYAGRLPVTEFMVPTSELVRLMLSGAPPYELQAQAVRDGMVTMLTSALERVGLGETTLEEVDRVVGLGDGPSNENDSAPSAKPGTVPIDRSPQAQVVETTPDPRASLENDDVVEPAGPDAPHILLVDDDGTTRAIAKALLERKMGFRVSESEDGSNAILRLAKGEKYSLVVLDLDMPLLGGREVLTAIRQSTATVALPVIVLTGTPDPDSEIELMEMGADDYLRKPLDPARLMTRVKAALRRAQG